MTKIELQEYLKNNNFYLITELIQNSWPGYISEFKKELESHPDYETLKYNYIIDEENNTLLQIFERIPLDEVADLTEEERFLYPMCNKEEIKRISNVQTTEDYLLKYRTDQIVDDSRLSRVLLKIRTKTQNWNFSNYFNSKYFTDYLESLPQKERDKCTNVCFGTIYMKKANGYCIKTKFGDIVVISFSLYYFLYYMNLFHLGKYSDFSTADITNSFIIAIRTMLGNEALDFEIDCRGQIPQDIDDEVKDILYGQMMFVIGHEFAHHYLEHLKSPFTKQMSMIFDNSKKEQTIYNYKQLHEFEADYNSVMTPEISDSERTVLINGAFTFFLWLDIFEVVQNFISPPDSSMKTHPEPIDRLWELRKKVDNKFGASESELSKLIDSYKPFKEQLLEDLPVQVETFETYGSVYLPSFKQIQHDRLNF